MGIKKAAEAAARWSEIIMYEDGTYKGDIGPDNQPCGFGIFQDEDQTIYMHTTNPENQISVGLINWYLSEKSYIGDLKFTKRHGFGKNTLAEITTIGLWENDVEIIFCDLHNDGEIFCG